MPVKNHHHWHHHRQYKGKGKKAEDMEDGKEKKKQEEQGFLLRQRPFHRRQGRNGTFREKTACHVDKKAADKNHRPRDGKECEKGQMVVVVDEKILRISNGREHTSHIGGYGFQRNQGNERCPLPDFQKGGNGKGNENDEGYVIGNHHGREKAGKDEKACHLPHRPLSGEKTKAQGPGNPPFPDFRRNDHKAEKNAQKIPVNASPKKGRGKGHEKAGENGKERGQQQIRIFFDHEKPPS